MKESKPLSESQLELLETKSQQVRIVLNRAQDLQRQQQQRIERMKIELDIPENEIKQWQVSKDGKAFEREKQIKKTTVKDNKKKK